MPEFGVAVIIPCYNQGHFLADAIGSVLAQTHRPTEVIVIDDGSTDNTRSVVEQYPSVQYAYQSNKGLAAARNSGLRLTTAPCVTFLDADDVLAPHALLTGVQALAANPDCAFVTGDYRLVGPDLRPLFRFRSRPVTQDHYAAFLRGNWVGMHATVMYRRQPLVQTGAFQEDLKACEDYSVYLRLARDHRVFCHGAVIADYRQHDGNMSRDPEFMLHWALTVHRAEKPFLKGDPALMQAYAEGERNLRDLYRGPILARLKQEVRISSPYLSFRRLLFAAVEMRVCEQLWRESVDAARRIARGAARRLHRTTVWPHPGHLNFGSFRTHTPREDLPPGQCSVSEWYCRHWQTQFEREARECVLDLDVAGVDPQSLREIPSGSQDAILCFMCLQRAYDPDLTLGELHRILKPSGLLIGTLPGPALRCDAGDRRDWWRFTALSARELLLETFGEDADLRIHSYGNVLAALGELHRIPATEFRDDELLDASAELALVVGISAIRRPGNDDQHTGPFLVPRSC